MESTPGKGAATGSEGVRMLEIMAELKEFLDKPGGRPHVTARTPHTCLDQLRRTLWLPDLGRYAWYEDSVGEKRLDTTYHGIAYPVIYGQLDAFDSKSALDHLKHRLSGPEGEIYQSNHFGDHAYWDVPHLGMQCGSGHELFATAAYAAVGDAQAAVRPWNSSPNASAVPTSAALGRRPPMRPASPISHPPLRYTPRLSLNPYSASAAMSSGMKPYLPPVCPEDSPSAGLTPARAVYTL